MGGGCTLELRSRIEEGGGDVPLNYKERIERIKIQGFISTFIISASDTSKR